MQKLVYESSWNKALPQKDRHTIENVFEETKFPNQHTIHFTPLWQAMNYRGELLVTVLVHNFTTEPFSFDHTSLQYLEDREILASRRFTLPQLTIQPETSMPWAFIFPRESLNKQHRFADGYMEFVP